MADDAPTDAAAPEPTLAPVTAGPEPTPELAEAAAPTLADRIAAAIAGWRDDRLANSPLSRVAEAWSHLNAEIPTLIAAIVKEL